MNMTKVQLKTAAGYLDDRFQYLCDSLHPAGAELSDSGYGLVVVKDGETHGFFESTESNTKRGKTLAGNFYFYTGAIAMLAAMGLKVKRGRDSGRHTVNGVSATRRF